MVQVKRGDVEHILTSILNRAEEQLLKKSQKELEESFNFMWDEKASVEWNIYKFSHHIEFYKKSCRRWEEHHNGSCCVVERVRDKYLMPKIRRFLQTLRCYQKEQWLTPSKQ